jgi:hypothetical protein
MHRPVYILSGPLCVIGRREGCLRHQESDPILSHTHRMHPQNESTITDAPSNIFRSLPDTPRNGYWVECIPSYDDERQTTEFGPREHTADYGQSSDAKISLTVEIRIRPSQTEGDGNSVQDGGGVCTGPIPGTVLCAAHGNEIRIVGNSAAGIPSHNRSFATRRCLCDRLTSPP